MNSFFVFPESRIVDFKIAFWAGLYSGAITSIIVGLVIGIILWQIQKKSEEREVTRQCERDLSLFVQNLRSYLNRNNIIPIPKGAKEALPTNASRSLYFINNNPVNYWIEKLNVSKYPYLSKINEIMKVNLEFENCCHDLDSVLLTKLAEHYNPRSMNYNLAKEFILLLFVGVKKDDISTWFANLDTNITYQYYEDMLVDTRINSTLSAFQHKRTQLLNLLTELRDMLT